PRITASAPRRAPAASRSPEEGAPPAFWRGAPRRVDKKQRFRRAWRRRTRREDAGELPGLARRVVAQPEAPRVVAAHFEVKVRVVAPAVEDGGDDQASCADEEDTWLGLAPAAGRGLHADIHGWQGNMMPAVDASSRPRVISRSAQKRNI